MSTPFLLSLGENAQLRTGAYEQEDKKAAAVARRCKKAAPSSVLVRFASNGALDLVDLVDDEFVIHLAVRVIVSEYLVRALILALGNEPSRRFGHERRADEQDEGSCALKGGDDAPGCIRSPVVLDGDEPTPGRCRGADVVTTRRAQHK